MNFTLIFKYLGVLMPIVTSLETIIVSIANGQQASSPPIPTYLEGVHGALTIVWTPIPTTAVVVDAATVPAAHAAATAPAAAEESASTQALVGEQQKAYVNPEQKALDEQYPPEAKA